MSQDEKDEPTAIERFVDWMLQGSQASVEGYVDKLRQQNPSLSNRELAKKIVRRKSLKNGLVGAITGVGGLLTLPVMIPTDVAMSWRIQIAMVVAVARVFGHTEDTMDLKTDVLLVLAGDSAKEALKRVGIEVTKAATRKAVDRYVTREMMKAIWKVVGKKIVTKAGEKSLLSFARMVPLVGAPVGFGFDWVMARKVGAIAIAYYSGEA